MVKNKKLSKSSVAIIVLALLLIASLVMGMTGAWFTATKEGGGNQTLTFGTVRIALDGTGQDGAFAGEFLSGTEGIQAEQSIEEVVPGTEYTAQLTVENAGSEDLWFYIHSAEVELIVEGEDGEEYDLLEVASSHVKLYYAVFEDEADIGDALELKEGDQGFSNTWVADVEGSESDPEAYYYLGAGDGEENDPGTVFIVIRVIFKTSLPNVIPEVATGETDNVETDEDESETSIVLNTQSGDAAEVTLNASVTVNAIQAANNINDDGEQIYGYGGTFLERGE